MRKIYFLFAFTAALPAVAQPTLTNVLNYSVGDSVKYRQCDSNGFSPGGSGASQTWNFSNLVVTDSFVTAIASPSSTPNGSQFPSATIAELGPAGSEVYVNNSGNSYSVVGIVPPGIGLVLKYPNPQKVLNRPLNYTDLLVDTFTSQYSYMSQSISGGGVSTAEADGYGTLVLPDSTYTDVLRVRHHFIEHDSLSGLPVYVTIEQVSYMWFVDGYKGPILRADSLSVQTPGPAINTVTVAYRPRVTPVSVAEIAGENSDFSAYIGEGELKIKGKLDNTKSYNVRLYNQAGQVLLNKAFHGASTEYNVAIPGMPPGMYVVALREEGSNAPVYYKTIKK